jgi:hypothetical protein
MIAEKEMHATIEELMKFSVMSMQKLYTRDGNKTLTGEIVSLQAVNTNQWWTHNAQGL